MFNALDDEFRFGVDLCADLDNAKCERFLLADVSLSQSWRGMGVGFLNPPFADEIVPWLKKTFEQSEQGATFVVVVPGRTNPPWWHEYVMKAAELRFVKRKASFDEPGGTQGVPPYGIVIAIFYPFAGREYPKVTSWDYVRDKNARAKWRKP